jgi:hypothetical protein
MLIDKFGSAIEYLLNKMVELEDCIKNVKNVKIKFDEEFIENGEKILGINF